MNYQWNITGHSRQLQELENDLLKGNLPHAYLFAGPANIGKFSTALQLAQILQCEKNCWAEADNTVLKCQTCFHIAKGSHADTLVLEDNGDSIKIEGVRDILRKLSTTTQGRYKILLVKNIERMTVESANAFLKTLEDPPPQVIFLFTTSHIDELLKTVLSRVRVYKFQNLDAGILQQFLKERFPDQTKETLKFVSDMAFGKPGKALMFLQNPELFERFRVMYQQLTNFLQQPDIASSFAYINEITKEEGQPVEDFLDVFCLVLRDTITQEVRISARTEVLGRAVKLIEQIHAARPMLKRNVNSRLVLENLMLGVAA